MEGRTDLVIGQGKVFREFCPICGRAIYEGDRGCPVYHIKKLPKRKRFSGKSKTPFGKYEDK